MTAYHESIGGARCLPAALRRGPAVLCALLLALHGENVLGAPSPQGLVEQGNAHYAAGRFQEALDCYKQAAAASPTPSAELLHDQAAAQYRLGQFDEARDLWARARPLGDAAFEARARYNLGNCDYAEALAKWQAQDAGGAVDLLAKAAEHYRDAVGLDPTLADARANLELTHLLKKQIEQQMQQQPQQNQQDQEGRQDQQNSQQQASSQPAQQDQQEQQPQPEQQSDSPQQQDQSPQQDPNHPAGATSEPTAESQEEQAGEEESDAQRPPIEMTPQQAERLLQMVRDAEKQRREMLARRRQARYKPVERDW